jgi:uncharacterized membrane-anchored protein YhcB (DUF1043 family)
MMSETQTLAQRIFEDARALPEDSLLQLARYAEILRSRTEKARSLRERLARDYDELAAHYDEIAAELADEVWLPLENEALLHTERDTDS